MNSASVFWNIRLEEYKELNSNMRHYAHMRFVQLTLFVALMGAVFAAISQSAYTSCQQQKFLMYFVTMLIAAVFWVMEERGADYWNHFRNRALTLEQSLDCDQYRRRPPEAVRHFNATNATRVVFFFLPLFLIYHIGGSLGNAAYPLVIWFVLFAVYFIFICRKLSRQQ